VLTVRGSTQVGLVAADGWFRVRPGNRKIGSTLSDAVTALGNFTQQTFENIRPVVGYRRCVGNIRNSANQGGIPVEVVRR
jgi:hypothetical protein